MFSATFTWEPGDYDDEFHRLNAIIDDIARSSPGFAGSEAWRSADGRKNCVTYYWASLDMLEAFSRHPAHCEAKRQYARWYRGFHVVISEVLRSYGDGGVDHVTPNERRGG